MAQQESAIARMQHSLESSTLEMAYEKACQKVEMVCESELARQLRLEMLLLEDENEDLYTQLAQGDERIDDLEQHVLDLEEDIGAGVESLDTIQEHLRIQIREAKTLKAQLNSLSGVTMDSTKLLTEKLTLARELSNVKPELDHLRSQATSHQSLLAEKLSLQRQLNTLQVEIENEKRSTQRLAAIENKPHGGDSNVEARLEAVQAELAKEKRERQHMDREAQKVSAALESKITMYESRLDAFRSKLKSTKDLLKKTQGDLQKADVAKVYNADILVLSVPAGRTSRKRTASEIEPDTMIGTPGYLPLAKKSRAKSTLPGEKSTFSITPFLNRTAGVGWESPVPFGHRNSEEDDNERVAAQSSIKSKKASGASRPIPRNTREDTIVNVNGNEGDGGVAGDKLATTATADENQKPVKRAAPRRTMVAPKLAQVLEEVGSLKMAPDAVTKAADSKATSSKDVDDGPEKKKVKRRILGAGPGKTLFDEDDGDAPKDGSQNGAPRGFGKLGRGNLRGLKFGAEAGGGLGAFSPLKKDRKAGVA